MTKDYQVRIGLTKEKDFRFEIRSGNKKEIVILNKEEAPPPKEALLKINAMMRELWGDEIVPKDTVNIESPDTWKGIFGESL